MAVNRNKFDKQVELAESIYSHYYDSNTERITYEKEHFKEHFDIKVMVVGHFNAGKSSLINELLKIPDFLEEAQEPQTAIATELVYDEHRSSYAYPYDGEVEPWSDSKYYSPEKYIKLMHRLPSPALKAIGDFTIVDTPGLDSGIENHIKALSQYIGKGSAFIVVIDQEKGGIDRNTLGFIEEVSQYSRGQVAVLINKCDKITDEMRDEIVQGARKTLESRFMSFPVFAVSRFDKDISEKLICIINQFDAQKAFDFVMKQNLRNGLTDLLQILESTKQLLCFDTYDLDTEIAENKKLLEEIEGSISHHREEYYKKIDNKTEEIIEQIRGALIERADSISDAILSGNETAAHAIITETIRPIMLTVSKNNSLALVDSISKDLAFDKVTSSSDYFDVALSLATKLKEMIVSGTFELYMDNNDSSKVLFLQPKVEANKNKHVKDIYHFAAGIASICTDVIAPWMEIVIVLAPDIISVVSSLFKESESEQAKRLFINNAIPQICNRLYPEVKDSLEKSGLAVLEAYRMQLGEKITAINLNIIEAENKKKDTVESFEQYKKMLDDDISLIKNELTNLQEVKYGV